MKLIILDITFYFLHISVILLNLFLWLIPRFRRWHLIIAGLTLFSWFVIGLKYGMGYCPLTDWHWEVKRHMGQTNLANSFVKHLFDQFTLIELTPKQADLLTGVSFGVAIILSLIVNIKFLINQNKTD